MSGRKGAVLIVGGGISGIQSALDLAEGGFQVHVVDQCPSPGGLMAQLEKTFPTHDCSFCILEPKLIDAASHEAITFITNSQVEKVEGKAGDFKVTIKENPRYIDPSRCSDCKECIANCGPGAIMRYHAALSTKISSLKEALRAAVPVYFVDADKCDDCGSCEEVCQTGAIITNKEPKVTDLEVQSIILATGSKTFDPSGLSELGHRENPNVIISIELERMLSMPGTYSGLVTRPSDGETPKKVAFIQCVGSRDERTNTYCSSICCMAAIKEAILLVERFRIQGPTIFHMDIRAFGKEYETFYEIARERYNVKFRNSRVADIEQVENNDLMVKFVDESGKAVKERFDMVVLSVGLEPSSGSKRLSEAVGVELNDHGFIKARQLTPLDTSVEGIFASGAALAPKDIPDSVVDASASSMLASMTAHGSTIQGPKMVGSELRDTVGEVLKIGVFICHCGEDLGKAIDIAGLVETTKALSDVALVEDGLDLCAPGANEELAAKLKDNGLNRAVLVGCTPRLLEPIIRQAMITAGLNPYLFEVANIREHCAWVHRDDRASATDKAKALVNMAVCKVRDDIALPLVDLGIERRALVLGGGVSGMIAALCLTKRGFEVDLVEKDERLGGHLHHIKYLIEGEDDPQAFLEQLIKDIDAEPKVKVHLRTELKGTEGVPGLFRSSISGPDGETEVSHGAIIVATGGVEYKPTEYMYGKNPAIITQSELEERISSGSLKSDAPAHIVMIQCVGSRNKDHPYCSRICCSVAVKNALKVKEVHPGAEVLVLYKDMRTYGFLEDHFRKARGTGVHFTRYSDVAPPKVTDKGGLLHVTFDDSIVGEQVSVQADLVVLSTAVHPNPDNEALAKALKVPISKDGFLLEAHMKMRPVDFMTEGIYLCGLAHGPRSASESIAQATAAAGHAAILLSKPQLLGEVIVAQVDPAKCRGCGRCEEVCEYGAIRVVTETIDGSERMLSHVDGAKCKACGKCSVICCNKSITMKHFTTGQMERVIEAALEVERS